MFDTLVSVQNQLRPDPEQPTANIHLIRSRLIALAIATLKSQYRRELICAVFGLLSLVGHAANRNSNDGQGEARPLSELMGYGPLGIVFGPLLIGELLNNYNLRLPNPYGGLIVLPLTPPRSKKEKEKEKTKNNRRSQDMTSFATHVDKIKVVNGITEMLITHWQDVVCFLRVSQALRAVPKNLDTILDAPRRPRLRPSASEAFAPRISGLGKFLYGVSETHYLYTHVSTDASDPFTQEANDPSFPSQNTTFLSTRRRSKSQPAFSKRFSGSKPVATLSKTVEERTSETCAGLDTQNNPSPEITFLGDQQHTPGYKSHSFISTVFQEQDDSSKAATTKFRLGSKTHTASDDQNRVLRLPQRQPTYFRLEQRTQKDEDELASSEFVSPNIVPEAKSAQSAKSKLYEIKVPDPEHGTDAGSRSTHQYEYSSASTNRISIPQEARPWVMGIPLSNGIPLPLGGTTDALNRVSPEEDIASLADLAQALLQNPESDSIKSRDESVRQANINMSNPKRHSRNPFTREKESNGSSSSSNYATVPASQTATGRGNESSASGSSPLSLFLSKRRKGTMKQKNSNMASVKFPEPATSTPARQSKHCSQEKSSNSTSCESLWDNPSKLMPERRRANNPIRATPRGTVKALVAKFSLASPPLALSGPVTKASVASAGLKQESPRTSIISHYTKNPPASIKSQRSGISDISTKEAQGPPQIDVQLRSPKKGSFAGPLSKRQSWSSISQVPPSRGNRIPLEKCTTSIKDPGDDVPTQCNINACGVSANVNRLCIQQPDLLKTPISCVDQASTTSGEGRAKLLAAVQINSEMHEQIQSLQLQLNAKTEEVYQLKKLLESQESSDVVTLIENVAEAQREIQFWKSRAELCEKQIEMMRKTPSRASSKRAANSSSKSVRQSCTSTLKKADYVDTNFGSRSQDVSLFDGAASKSSQGFENGSIEGFYGFHNATSSNDNGNWVEQTMRALRRTEL